MTVDKKQIEHPEHYARMQVVIEPRHLTELFTGNISNVLKYLCRAGYKEGESREKDLLKTRQYALFAIETDYAYDKELTANASDFGENARYLTHVLPTDNGDDAVKVKIKCWRPHTYSSEHARYARGVIAIMRTKSRAIDALFTLSWAGHGISPEHNSMITSVGLALLVQLIEKELGINPEKDHA